MQCMEATNYLLREQFEYSDGWRLGLSLLFSDEAKFIQNGIFISHNSYVWADEIRHASFVTARQERFSINVWDGIISDVLVGPVFLPTQLNGERYLDFLQNLLPGFPAEIPLQIRRFMWYQHDGAPPHFPLDVREYQNATFVIRLVEGIL